MKETATDRRSLALVIVAAFSGFGCLYLLLPTVPLIAEESSGRLGAGMATGVFMTATVVSQALMPWILRRFEAHTAFVLGLLILGFPGLCYGLSPHIAMILTVTAVRGLGFGVVAVMGAALCALFADPARRGRALGTYGFFTAGAGIVFPPIGVAIFDAGLRDTLFVASSAVAVGGGVLAWLSLPRRALAVPAAGAVGAVLRDRGVAASLVSFFPAAMLFGAIYSFLVLLHPQVGSRALLGFGVAMTAGRLVAGSRVDRTRFPVLLIPAVASTVLGSLALGLVSHAAATVIAAAAAGMGCGVLGTATLADVMRRCGPANYAASSTAWNLCFDGGAAIGSSGLAVVAATGSLEMVFWVAAASVAAGALAAWCVAPDSQQVAEPRPVPPVSGS
jgi:predicted MFS family arabinose efflux permease